MNIIHRFFKVVFHHIHFYMHIKSPHEKMYPLIKLNFIYKRYYAEHEILHGFAFSAFLFCSPYLQL